MVKKRVHELAKELNIESKEIINKLATLGVSVKSHMSTLEDHEVENLVKHFSGGKMVHGSGKSVAQTPKNDSRVERERRVQNTGNKAAEQSGENNTRNDDRKQGKRDSHHYDRGPGLVDRVPSRPPDKRFTERPEGGNRSGAKPVHQNQPGHPGQAASHGRQGATGQVNRPRPDGGERGPRDDRGGQPQRPRPGGERGGFQGGGKGPNRHVSSERNEQGQRPAGRSGGQGPRPGYQGPRPGGQGPRPGGQGPRPGGQGPRPGGQGPRPGGQGPRPGGQGPRPGGGQLKVPKVPQEAPGVEKVRADKTRGEKARQQEKLQRETGRTRKRIDERLEDRKLRPHGGKKKDSQHQKSEHRPAPVVEKKPVVIGESVTVQELAEKMKKSPAELIKRLMLLGVLATINQEIDSDTAAIVAGEFGYEVEIKIQLDAEQLIMQEPEEDPTQLVLRPCVVTVMGHVDHGKTSLLDAIRKSNVTATEAGGITQHIGAYQVEHNNKKITFVDTPGHEAFTAMRARGAKVTDIAILVVAADDGVMPQTIEAINHSKAAEVPIIVAVNKIDKEGANQDRVKQQLTEYELVAEEWGGETIFVPVSAITGEGLEDLLEMILLVSEVAELKANPNREARGTVIEAELDKGRGPVATVLVQNGTLFVGDNIIAGTAFGRVRAMMDDKGRRVKKAGPSTPVEVLGFNEVPLAGDPFYVVREDKLARQISEKRITRKREEDFKAAAPKISLDDLFKHIKEGQVKELPVIIKSDVQGSTEALKQSLERLSTDEVKVSIIHGGVGAITESDIMLASASNAIVIGFNVRPDVNARRVAENEKVDIRLYRVIYDAIEDVKAAMSGLLDPEFREVILGRVEIRKTFKVSKVGTIAGCYVTDGKIVRDSSVRLIRDGIVVFEGKLDSLKRFKDDVKEVVQGYECGVTLENYNDLHEGDIIEAFTTEAIKRELT